MNLKISVSMLALDNKKNLKKFIKILKDEKINYLELPITKIFDNYNFNLKKLRIFKQLLKKNSLKISSIQSIFFGKEQLNIFDRSQHKAILSHIKKILRFSKYLGAKNIIFGSPIKRKLKKLLQKKKKKFKKKITTESSRSRNFKKNYK